MNAVLATHDAAYIAEASARLRALPPLYAAEELARMVRALCQAGMLLLGADRALAAQLRRELSDSTGLSAEMIEWGLDTTFHSVRPDVLEALAREVSGTPGLVPVPAKLVAVVLAGNVFSAAVRAMFLPLLSGAPVLVKAASADGVLPRALRRALEKVDPELAQRCEVVGFGRDASAALQALLADAEVVSVYGDDSSLQAIGARTRPGARLLQHGHGLSASFVSNQASRNAAGLRDAALRVALDVAAYDQRGCLSSQLVFVERGAREFARVLAEQALPELAGLLPPGAAGLADRALAMQWRAAAQVRGELFEGRTHAVSYEAQHAPRPSPGGRLVSVYDCAGPEAVARALAGFGGALKCVGVAAGSRQLRLQLAQCLRPLAAARVCRAGEMQTPAFHAYADGQPPLAGLLSFSEAD